MGKWNKQANWREKVYTSSITIFAKFIQTFFLICILFWLSTFSPFWNCFGETELRAIYIYFAYSVQKTHVLTPDFHKWIPHLIVVPTLLVLCSSRWSRLQRTTALIIYLENGEILKPRAEASLSAEWEWLCYQHMWSPIEIKCKIYLNLISLTPSSPSLFFPLKCAIENR